MVLVYILRSSLSFSRSLLLHCEPFAQSHSIRWYYTTSFYLFPLRQCFYQFVCSFIWRFRALHFKFKKTNNNKKTFRNRIRINTNERAYLPDCLLARWSTTKVHDSARSFRSSMMPLDMDVCLVWRCVCGALILWSSQRNREVKYHT